MFLIRKGKTNLKYILILVTLAIFVGGGILWWTSKEEAPVQPPELKKPGETKETAVNPAEDIINPEFTKYFNTLLESNPELKFTKAEPRQIIYGEKTTFPAPPSNKEDPIWIFSLDGRKAVSIFGYFGEPDSRLDVYNRNNDGKVENLTMCGTPCSYWIVFWLNNEQFIFIQSSENYLPIGEVRYVLNISLYDLVKNTETVYQSQELDKSPQSPIWPEWNERTKKVCEKLFGETCWIK